MNMRKMYLHLDDPNNQLEVRVKPLNPEWTNDDTATCALELRYGNNVTRTWINGNHIKLRRDLLGWYFVDYRQHPTSDKIFCTRSMRSQVSELRPDVGFCAWRTAESDY